MGELIGFPHRPENFSTQGNLALQIFHVDNEYHPNPKRRRHLSVVSDDNELSQIQALQDQWDSTLRIKKRKAGEFANYNPVLARWGFERLETEEHKEQLRINELQNVMTALRERNHTAESRLTLTIGKDKKIHNEVFPDSSYGEVLERGRKYRAENGSNETEREEAEIRGFLKIQDALTDPKTEVGTKFFIVSPPGLQKDTPYVHNFVDSYELVEDVQGMRAVRYTRFSSPLEYDHYKEIAEGFEPNYFGGQEGPVDAWYLANPIFVAAQKHQTTDEVFAEHFAKDVKAMEEKEFQKLWEIYSPFVLYYLDQITKDEFDPIAIAEAYNSLLLSTEDKDLQKETKERIIFVPSNATQLGATDTQRIASMVNYYGRREVKQVMAGCGSSGGISFGAASAEISGSTLLDNSVAQFGGDKYGSLTFKCPEPICGKVNMRKRNELKTRCDHCGSRKVACEEPKDTKTSESKQEFKRLDVKQDKLKV